MSRLDDDGKLLFLQLVWEHDLYKPTDRSFKAKWEHLLVHMHRYPCFQGMDLSNHPAWNVRLYSYREVVHGKYAIDGSDALRPLAAGADAAEQLLYKMLPYIRRRHGPVSADSNAGGTAMKSSGSNGGGGSSAAKRKKAEGTASKKGKKDLGAKGRTGKHDNAPKKMPKEHREGPQQDAHQVTQLPVRRGPGRPPKRPSVSSSSKRQKMSHDASDEEPSDSDGDEELQPTKRRRGPGPKLAATAATLSAAAASSRKGQKSTAALTPLANQPVQRKQGRTRKVLSAAQRRKPSPVAVTVPAAVARGRLSDRSSDKTGDDDADAEEEDVDKPTAETEEQETDGRGFRGDGPLSSIRLSVARKMGMLIEQQLLKQESEKQMLMDRRLGANASANQQSALGKRSSGATAQVAAAEGDGS